MTNNQYKLFLEIISTEKIKFEISNSDLKKIDVEILPVFMECLTGKLFNRIFDCKAPKFAKWVNRVTLSDTLWYKHNGFWLSKAESFTLNYLMESFCKYNNIEWSMCYNSDNIMIYLDDIEYNREVQKQFILDLKNYTQDFIMYIENKLKNQ